MKTYLRTVAACLAATALAVIWSNRPQLSVPEPEVERAPLLPSSYSRPYVQAGTVVATLDATRVRPEDRLAAVNARIDARLQRVGSSASLDSDEVLAEKYAKDPVASLFPSLGEEPRPRQLEALRWMRQLTAARIATAAPRLDAAFRDVPAERDALAVEAVDAMVALLEAEGHQAPALGDDFVLATITEELPEGLDVARE